MNTSKNLTEKVADKLLENAGYDDRGQAVAEVDSEQQRLEKSLELVRGAAK